MTKAQELEILDKAIAALGKDSYCGPWLATVRGQVEQFLRSDIFPQFSIVNAERECARMKAETIAFCDKQCEVAKAYATQLRVEGIKKADELATRQAANAKNTLRTAVRELNQLLDNLP